MTRRGRDRRGTMRIAVASVLVITQVLHGFARGFARNITEPAVTCLFNNRVVYAFVTPSPRSTGKMLPSSFHWQLISRETQRCKQRTASTTAACSTTQGRSLSQPAIDQASLEVVLASMDQFLLGALRCIRQEGVAAATKWPTISNHFSQALQLSGWSLRSIPHSAVPHWHSGRCIHHAV